MTSIELTVAADLYHAGITSDGEKYEAEMYYVVAEDADGSRRRHPTTLRGCKVANYDGENFFYDIRDEASQKADDLVAGIQIGIDAGQYDFAGWLDIDPRYGSPAYCRHNNC